MPFYVEKGVARDHQELTLRFDISQEEDLFFTTAINRTICFFQFVVFFCFCWNLEEEDRHLSMTEGRSHDYIFSHSSQLYGSNGIRRSGVKNLIWICPCLTTTATISRCLNILLCVPKQACACIYRQECILSLCALSDKTDFLNFVRVTFVVFQDFARCNVSQLELAAKCLYAVLSVLAYVNCMGKEFVFLLLATLL